MNREGNGNTLNSVRHFRSTKHSYKPKST